jgi:hypothetical protein
VIGALGDHEIGDDPWDVGSEKLQHLATMKRAFVARLVDVLGLTDPFPGVAAQPPQTEGYYASSAIRIRNVLFINLDMFDSLLPGESTEPLLGGVRLRVRGEHLDWVRALLVAAKGDSSLDLVVVQGHIPVLDPVRMHDTSGLLLTGREGSPMWQLLRQHDQRRGGKVRMYLAGEVHAPTVVRDPEGDIVQIVHGNPPRVASDPLAGNYLVFVVTSAGIEVELRRFDLYSDGTSLFWQPGTFSGNLVTEGPSAASGGRTEGRLTIDASGSEAVVTGTGWLRPVPFAGMPVNFQFDAMTALDPETFPPLTSRTAAGATI